MGILHVATEAEIVAGKTTDAYFERTVSILRRKNIHRQVTVEIRTGGLPGDWTWAVLAGVEEAVKLLARLKRKLTVVSAPEGTIFHAGDPVMHVSGDYLDICVYETPLLGLLCQATGIATTAARCRLAAGDKQLLSFGARRMHPAISPMIERAAYIGGCDGVAGVAGAKLIGEAGRGTMPHALVICMGDTVEATRAFHDIVGVKKIPTISLIDTFNDEKFEAIRVAESLGEELAAVRVDTPASRRGDFLRLLKEIRWELDLRGYQHVKIFVSGGINEDKIRQLLEVADGFGVGTFISNAPTVDLALDIVEVDGEPLAKRGKCSGVKVWWQNRDTFESVVQPRALSKSPGKKWVPVLSTTIRNGKLVTRLPKPQEIRARVLKQLAKMGL
jgi:nicotinate phosphoribosyltransferase